MTTISIPKRLSRKPRTPRVRRSPRRWLLLILVMLLVGGGLVAASVISAPPAQGSFLGLCDSDTTFPAPSAATGTPTHGGTVRATQLGDETFTVVTANPNANTPVRQYGGAGLEWHPWGQSCMDAMPLANTAVGQFLFEIVVLWPARILGLIIGYGFSTGIVDSILDAADGFVTGLSGNVFTAWAPLVVGLVLGWGVILIGRGRAKQALSSIGWMAVLLAATGLFLTPAGVGAMKSVNSTIASVTDCVAFGSTGDGCDINREENISYANAMVENLATDLWGIGAMGDMAMETPESYTLRIPVVSGLIFRTERELEYAIPVTAIPAVEQGKPTWGEIWRWTQTYTRAELGAMQSNPSLMCFESPEQSPPLAHILDAKGLDSGELCAAKWTTRAAIIAHVMAKNPGTMGAIRGDGMGRMSAAGAGIGTLVLALGLGVMAAMVFIYQLELVLLFLAAPIVALFGLRTPRVVRRWSEMMLVTAVKRVAIGFVLGLLLWASNFIAVSTSGLGMTGIFFPTTRALLTIGLMIAAALVFGKIKDLLLEAVVVPDSTGMAEEGGKKLLHTGVAAASGALAAGSGLRLAGAARGAGRAALHGATSTRGAWGAGMAGGTGARVAEEMQQRANKRRRAGEDVDNGSETGDDTPTPPPSPTPPPAPSGGGGGSGGGPVPPSSGDGPTNGGGAQPAPAPSPTPEPGPTPSPSPAPAPVPEPDPVVPAPVREREALDRMLAHPAVAPVVADRVAQAEARRDQLAHEAARLRQLVAHEKERAERLGEEAAQRAAAGGLDVDAARSAAIGHAYAQQVRPASEAVTRAEDALAAAHDAVREASQGVGVLGDAQRRVLAGEDAAQVAADLGGDAQLAEDLRVWAEAVIETDPSIRDAVNGTMYE